MEIWKDIKGYEGLYQVSNTGRVRALDRQIGYRNGRLRNWKGVEKVLTENTRGYLATKLYKDGKGATKEIHRFVAEAFIPNPDGKDEVNHIDGNKHNNHISNLEWVSHSENMRHSTEVLKNIKKRVLQYSLDGTYIQTFNSIKEAAEKTHSPRTAICQVVKGKRITAGGYMWRYAV